MPSDSCHCRRSVSNVMTGWPPIAQTVSGCGSVAGGGVPAASRIERMRRARLGWLAACSICVS